MKLYLLSGLGADYRVFEHLEIPNISTQLIEWIPPLKNESLASYAKRLAVQIEEKGPIHLLGVSFGGIVAQELSKIRACKTLIIVSSVKSRSEYSVLLNLARFIRIDKIIPGVILNWFGKIIGPFFFSLQSKSEKKMLRSIMDDTDITFLRWSIDTLMKWRGNNKEDIYHIHGSSDRIFPNRNISNYESIENGGHLMIYNKAEEINRLIASEIKKNG
ncbi:MAG: alpha/beta hydrolase [Bacteroidia bacterium]